MGNAIPIVAGAVLGAVTAEPVRRLKGRVGVIGAGAALVTAAVIYPASRREHPMNAAHLVEGAVVVAASTLAAISVSSSPSVGRRLLAAGWAAHALFDFGQGPSADSRLPDWYAPVCAGYDFAFAAQLLR
jgi:hypothetical protein